jgi:hypothetical protein
MTTDQHLAPAGTVIAGHESGGRDHRDRPLEDLDTAGY